MKKYLFIILLMCPMYVYADQTQAYCKVFGLGHDELVAQGTCGFSQYQGHVYLTLPAGQKISLSPVGDLPGNFRDSNSAPVYRKKGLGKHGQIYQFNDKVVYIYWDTDKLQVNVQIKPVNYNMITVNISDGNLVVKGNATRQINAIFTGVDKNNITIFNASSGVLLILNKDNGNILKEYHLSPIPSFEDPDTMRNSTKEPC